MHESKASKIVSFAVLALLLSYGLSFGFQWLVAVHRFPIDGAVTDLFANGLAVSGPTLAAGILLWLAGRSVREWLQDDLSQTRFSLWWLGIPVFTFSTTLLAFALAGADTSEILSLLGHVPSLLGFFAFHILVVGLLEELGWRGWLLRQLLVTQSPLLATLIIAPVWFAWHLPKLLSDATFAAVFAVSALVNSIILTALWARYRGRTALAAIAHGSFNAPIYFMAEQYPQANAVGAFTLVVSVYALVALTLLNTHKGWWLGKPLGKNGSLTAPSVAT